MHVCLSSELSLFLKVFVHVARWDVCTVYMCVWGYFWTVVHLCVCVCSVMSLTWQARTLIQSGGGSIWKRQGTYREQMIFIGLKRSGWPAGLVVTTGVMLHYDLKMTGDDAAPKRGERERGRGGGTGRAGWGVAVAQLRSFKVIIQNL